MRSNTLWFEIKNTFQRNDRIVSQLIIVNVAVFLLLNLIRVIYFLSNKNLSPDFYDPVLAVPSNVITLVHRPWTIVASLFTHMAFGHILYNMIFLFWFGRIFTEFAGNRKVLPLYLLGGITGSLFYIVMYNFLPVFQNVVATSSSIGASAAVLAIVAAAATLVPDYTVFLIFLGPVKIKWIALGAVVLYLISIPDGNAGGNIAHLGGLLFGFLYVKELQRGRDWGSGINWLVDKTVSLFREKPNMKISRSNKYSVPKNYPSNKPDTNQQERIDKILDKISQSGYDSLTEEEKSFLFNFSKEKKR